MQRALFSPAEARTQTQDQAGPGELGIGGSSDLLFTLKPRGCSRCGKAEKATGATDQTQTAATLCNMPGGYQQCRTQAGTAEAAHIQNGEKTERGRVSQRGFEGEIKRIIARVCACLDAIAWLPTRRGSEVAKTVRRCTDLS